MNDQTDPRANQAQRPAPDDHDAWHPYWYELGQYWRTEPEIEEARQEELSHRLDLAQRAGTTTGPFRGMRLGRADLEWLLANHEDGRGPVAWNSSGDPSREGLDLRGATLFGDLFALPLAALRAGSNAPASREYSIDFTHARLTSADLQGARLEDALLYGAQLDNAFLRDAHLEGADISNTHFEHADLRGAHLEGATSHYGPVHLKDARLIEVHLEGAILVSASMEGADLSSARLENANLSSAHLAGAVLRYAHLEGARLVNTHVGGKVLDDTDLERVRKWQPSGGSHRRCRRLTCGRPSSMPRLALSVSVLATRNWGPLN